MRTKTGATIFEMYEKLKNRIPTKAEFDLEFYGRILRHNESNHYYNVKRKWLAEKKMAGEA